MVPWSLMLTTVSVPTDARKPSVPSTTVAAADAPERLPPLPTNTLAPVSVMERVSASVKLATLLTCPRSRVNPPLATSVPENAFNATVPLTRVTLPGPLKSIATGVPLGPVETSTPVSALPERFTATLKLLA